MEQTQDNLLFRWFIGLAMDDAFWVPTVFSKNRERLIEHDNRLYMQIAIQLNAGPLQVPFGLRNGRLFEPLQVERGKGCGCTCPGCGAALIAKHAPAGKVSPHFAHAYGEGCSTGLESALHLAAKQLIADRNELYLPPLEPSVVKEGFDGRSVERKKLLRPGGLVPLSSVRLEIGLGDIRPDLIVAAPDLEVLVEVARTSFVTPEKLVKIKTYGKPAVEFDISKLHHLGFKDLETVLFTPSPSVKWVWHPEEATGKANLQALVDAEMEAARAQWEQEQAELEKSQREVDEEFALLGYRRSLAGERNGYAAIPAKKTFVSYKEQLARMQAFAQLSPQKQIEEGIQAMGADGARIRELLPLKVSGAHAIAAPFLAWQAPVFALFIHKAMKLSNTTVDAEVVRGWLRERFSISDDKAFGVAVWYFLKGLEELGILHRKFRQEFIVLVPDLRGALVVAKDTRAGQRMPLAWAPQEEAWPSREKSKAVARAFSEAFGDSGGWDRISGLLPAVRTLKTPEAAVRYYGNTNGRGITPEHVRRFLLATGFAF